MGVDFIGKCLLVETKKKKILAVGDLHLGFEEALNRSGVLVSREMFSEIIDYLERIFEKTGKVDEVVLLGDVKHMFGRILGQEWKEFLELVDYLDRKCEKIIVVKGNHDKIIEPIAKKKKIEVLDYYISEGFCFVHGDRDFEEMIKKNVKSWVMGHGHPAVKIKEPNGIKVEKFKCFLEGTFKRKKIFIVPSFFDYNLGSDPRENDLGLAWNFKLDNFVVRIVQEDSLEVLNFGKLKKLI